MTAPTHPRAYRKPITSHGLMYLGGKAREITVKNISITGLLAELDYKNAVIDSDDLLKNLYESQSVDFYFPELQLSGTGKLVRVETEHEQQILLAMEFEKIAYSANEPAFKRKSHRREIAILGRILINDQPHDFMTINMSLEGLMVGLPKQISVEKDAILPFEFADSKLKGFVKVVWSMEKEQGQTLVGLHFVKPKITDADSQHR